MATPNRPLTHPEGLKKTSQDLALKEIKKGVGKQALKAALGEGGKEIGKRTAGIATLFITFIESYSRVIRESALENVKRNLEGCPHIGQLTNYAAANTMACDTIATVWLAPDNYWYFHPQTNYKVLHFKQILRSTTDGGYRVEWPGENSDWKPDICRACEELRQEKLSSMGE